MVNFCAVIGCSNHEHKDIKKSFYCLPGIIKHQGSETEPLTSRRQREWLATINRSDIKTSNYQYTLVCSDPFISGCPSQLYDTTNPDWVPSISLGYIRTASGPATSNARYSRALMRASKRQRVCESDKDADEVEQNQQDDNTVSRVFHHVINVLFIKLKPLILWPERDILLATMLMCFRKTVPAQAFSTYKHHNTVKYLIGVTPQEICGLLNNLIPGGVILADRGFDISESVAAWAVNVTIPSFTRGKKQLSGIGIEQTRCIANVWIHVECVIGLLRQKYTILTETQWRLTMSKVKMATNQC
uniref:THAP-type domain-containing protein n=1 Tax=Amphimedon queenslandica TaxID=400682 RepID=A0A1X7U9K4_AMPQE